MPIRGSVDLRLELRGTDGSAVMVVFRLKILRGGWDKPHFLLLGAPALDAPPLGLGHRPLLHGHYFPALGLTVERKEAIEVQSKLLSIGAVFSDAQRGRFEAGAVGAPLWTADKVSQWPLCLVGAPPPEPLGSECDVVMSAPCEIGAPAYSAAEETVCLGLNEYALVPCCAPAASEGRRSR